MDDERRGFLTGNLAYVLWGLLTLYWHELTGLDAFGLIAGPCTVEYREQTLETARAVAQAGGTMLRGGAFKPRTSPYTFSGLGEEALTILVEAREETGLPVSIADDPLASVVLGTGKMLSDFKLLRKISIE